MRLLGRNRANLIKRVPTPIPTLNLDFVNGSYQYGNSKYASPNGITGFNFYNSTGGYAPNPNTGLLQYFPLNTPRITSNGYLTEQASTNLLSNSLGLAGTGWTSQNTTISQNNAIAPDGTQTATLNTANSTSTTGAGNYTTTGVAVTSGLTYTVSAYFKAGTSNFGVLIVNFSPTPYVSVVMNLTTGQITSTGIVAGSMFTNQTSKSEFVGNGWWRLSITWTAGATGNVPMVWGQCNTGTPTFQAGGNVSCTSGQTNYVWGGQFEQSVLATSYIPTYQNATTNLCQQSNYLANSPWISIASVTATNNASIAPNGTQTATLLTSSSNIGGYRQAITVVANTTYTWSFYAKLGTMTSASYSVFNISGSTELVVATSYTSKVNTNSWSRVSVTFTTPTGCTQIGVYPWRDGGSAGTLFIWGCQLETGSVATTFTPVSPAVTNFALRSQTPASWSSFQTTQTNNTTTAPDGTTTAGTITTSVTGNSNAYLASSYTSVAGTIFTVSTYLKAGSTGFGYLSVGAFPNYATIIVNLNTGAITQSGSSGAMSILTTSITFITNGWYRVSMTINPTSAFNQVISIASALTGTGTLNGYGIPISNATNTVFMWGTQLELGYGANQYVVTTTASASAVAQTSATFALQSTGYRSPDTMIFGSALGLNATNTKSMIAEGTYNYYPNSVGSGLSVLSDGTATNYIFLGEYFYNAVQQANYLLQILINSAFVKNIFQTGTLNQTNVIRKQAVSFGDNRIVISQNGQPLPDAGLGNGSFAGTVSFNQLSIGNNSIVGSVINGYIRAVKLYSSSLSQNQLNTLTNLQNN